MPHALQSGVPSSASLHSGVLFTLHDAQVFADNEARFTDTQQSYNRLCCTRCNIYRLNVII